MTSPHARSQRATKARNRLEHHRGRLAAAPAGSRQQVRAALDWLHAEVAAGGPLQELINLAESMNERASCD